MTTTGDRSKGLISALCAYVMWGFMPAYLRLLGTVDPLVVVSHRALWSCVFLALSISFARGWRELRLTFSGALASAALSAFLLSINWCLYVYAVSVHRIVDASLGYFINPLLNVIIGVAVLKEEMRRSQWLAIGVAACGVAWLTFTTGQPPWIGLTLAASFSLYGYVRKVGRLGSLSGLFLETVLVVPFALAYLFHAYLAVQTTEADFQPRLLALLAFSGVVTAVPLLMFAYGARRIPLSLMGIIQYVSPSIQFALGVFAFGERFSLTKLVGYVLIWLAVAGYAVEGLVRSWSELRRAKTSPG